MIEDYENNEVSYDDPKTDKLKSRVRTRITVQQSIKVHYKIKNDLKPIEKKTK